MKYVALIRGINVGGNNIVPMQGLAKTLEGIGLGGVSWYIASGNVFFESKERDARKLEKKIEAAMEKGHKVSTNTVVRSRDEMEATMKALPPSWNKPSPLKRYYVMFLRHEVNTGTVLDELEPAQGVEALTYGAGALFWETVIKLQTRSKIAKIMSRPLYKQVTIRNLNTTLKIAQLIAE
jgi:uncharacterized protein (DUF1697 family)